MFTRAVFLRAAGIVSLVLGSPASAELHGRDLDGNGLTFEAFYDDALNLTWLADASFAQTSGYDADGRLEWPAANAWATGLDYHGVTGWRLPGLAPLDGSDFNHAFSNNGTTDVGYGMRSPGSELAHLYYVTLGNLGYCAADDADPGSCHVVPGWGPQNPGPFVNLAALAGHWTGTESMCPCGSMKGWLFDFTTGRQYQLPKGSLMGAWPVRSGDVAPVRYLAGLTLKYSGVTGCKTVSGTVTLSKEAPLDGVVVRLGDSLASAKVPATVKVPYGYLSKSFTVTTYAVAEDEEGVVSATLGSKTLGQPLTVRRMGLYSLSLAPTSVAGGNLVAGKATLSCKAGPGPVTVELASSNAAVANPIAASIVVPQGLQSASFDVTTSPVPGKTTATITATANGSAKSRALTITSAASVSPTSLKFGTQYVGSTSEVMLAMLTNKGVLPFTVTSIGLTGTGAASFGQTNDCPPTLDAGASCAIGVTFTPMSATSKTAKLSIATSAAATPLSVSLSGTGLAPP